MRRLTQISGMVSVLAAMSICVRLCADVPAADSQSLASVDGREITRADFELACAVRGLTPEQQSRMEDELLERLIDEQLIAAYLKTRRVEASPVAIDAQVDLMKSLVRRRGAEPEELLSRLGLTEDQLRQTLSLPLAWQTYVSQVITDEQLRNDFAAHRRELDGTQLRASHIVLPIPALAPADEWQAASDRLTRVRNQIADGEITFTEAAKTISQGPSAAEGGDIGFFPYRGVMSAAFADAAFSLKPDEISSPIRTPAGMHLIKVVDEQPGQLSLEDVRSTVVNRISQKMWDEKVLKLRMKAHITRRDRPDREATPQ